MSPFHFVVFTAPWTPSLTVLHSSFVSFGDLYFNDAAIRIGLVITICSEEQRAVFTQKHVPSQMPTISLLLFNFRIYYS